MITSNRIKFIEYQAVTNQSSKNDNSLGDKDVRQLLISKEQVAIFNRGVVKINLIELLLSQRGLRSIELEVLKTPLNELTVGLINREFEVLETPLNDLTPSN